MTGRSCRTVLVAGALLIVYSLDAAGQPPSEAPSPRPYHLTVSGGLAWTGGYDIGDLTAQLRGNTVGAAAPPFTLFRARSSVDAAAGLDARVGVAVTRAVTVEFGVTYQRPGITTALSQDAEAAAVTLEAEQLAQYVFDVGVLWQLPRVRFGARARPFALAGGGYLRQLYEERTLVERGSVYYAGGGLRYWLRGGDGSSRAFGIRADGRLQWRLDGVEFEGRTRVAPAFVVQAFVEF